MLATLIVSQLVFAVSPGRRSYPAVLALTLAGMLAGQAWEGVGLPGLHLGQADLVPGALFAVALQPLARTLTTIRWRRAHVFQVRSRGK